MFAVTPFKCVRDTQRMTTADYDLAASPPSEVTSSAHPPSLATLSSGSLLPEPPTRPGSSSRSSSRLDSPRTSSSSFPARTASPPSPLSARSVVLSRLFWIPLTARAGHRAPLLCQSPLHWLDPRLQEPLEEHRQQHGQVPLVPPHRRRDGWEELAARALERRRSRRCYPGHSRSVRVPGCVSSCVVLRGAFADEDGRAGQKCSALARLYVPRSLWEAKGGFKDILLEEIAKITVGPPEEFQHYMGPVMSAASLSPALAVAKDRTAAPSFRTTRSSDTSPRPRPPAERSSAEELVRRFPPLQPMQFLTRRDCRRRLDWVLRSAYRHRDQGPQVCHHGRGDLWPRSHRLHLRGRGL